MKGRISVELNGVTVCGALAEQNHLYISGILFSFFAGKKKASLARQTDYKHFN